MSKFTNPDIYLASGGDSSHEDVACSEIEQNIASIIKKERSNGMVDLKFDFEEDSTKRGRLVAVEEFLSGEATDITDKQI